jgi:hypothetical protein
MSSVRRVVTVKIGPAANGVLLRQHAIVWQNHQVVLDQAPGQDRPKLAAQTIDVSDSPTGWGGRL